METVLSSDKVRKIRIGVHILENWLKSLNSCREISNTPKDLTILHVEPVWFSTMKYQFEVLAFSEAFTPITKESVIPYFEVIFTQRNDRELDKEREAIAVMIEEQGFDFLEYCPDPERPTQVFHVDGDATLENIVRAIRSRKGAE